ncbi:MAG: hypothetical protein ABFD50_08385 [Smithella sp.]
MKDFSSRIKKIESLIDNDKTEAARQLVSFMVETGLIKEADAEAQVAKFAGEGLSMQKILKELDGTSLGPPSLRKKGI